MILCHVLHIEKAPSISSSRFLWQMLWFNAASLRLYSIGSIARSLSGVFILWAWQEILIGLHNVLRPGCCWICRWEWLTDILMLLLRFWRVWTDLTYCKMPRYPSNLSYHLREWNTICCHQFLLLWLFPFVWTLRCESFSWRCATNFFIQLNLLMIVLPNIIGLVSTASLLEVFYLFHLVCINVICYNQWCEIVKHSNLLLLMREINIDDALWCGRCQLRWLMVLRLIVLNWPKGYFTFFNLITGIKNIGDSFFGLRSDCLVVLKFPIHYSLFGVCSLDNLLLLVFRSVHLLGK